jgi:hypothetical protein
LGDWKYKGSPILAILMMEAIRSSETSVLTRVALRNIPEHGVRSKASKFTEREVNVDTI